MACTETELREGEGGAHLARMLASVLDYWLLSRGQLPEPLGTLLAAVPGDSDSNSDSERGRRRKQQRRMAKFLGDVQQQLAALCALFSGEAPQPLRVAFLLGASSLRPLDAVVVDLRGAQRRHRAEPAATATSLDALARRVLRQLVTAEAAAEQPPRECCASRLFVRIEASRASPPPLGAPFVPCVGLAPAAEQPFRCCRATSCRISIVLPAAATTSTTDPAAIAPDPLWFSCNIVAKCPGSGCRL